MKFSKKALIIVLLSASFCSTVKPEGEFWMGVGLGAFTESVPPITWIVGGTAAGMGLYGHGNHPEGKAGFVVGFAAMAATQLYVGYKIYQKFR
ncbi:MAG TPA: hypothetical protein QGF02_04245 [Candidatus Babeliales bacterium]|nr:hypothetical protein [Candidatus Babeliales bacterium]